MLVDSEEVGNPPPPPELVPVPEEDADTCAELSGVLTKDDPTPKGFCDLPRTESPAGARASSENFRPFLGAPTPGWPSEVLTGVLTSRNIFGSPKSPEPTRSRSSADPRRLRAAAATDGSTTPCESSDRTSELVGESDDVSVSMSLDRRRRRRRRRFRFRN